MRKSQIKGFNPTDVVDKGSTAQDPGVLLLTRHGQVGIEGPGRAACWHGGTFRVGTGPEPG